MPAQPLDRPAQQQLPRPRAGAGDPLVREVRVARQAIYDPNRHLRAFELQFRAGGRDAEAVVGEKATSQVVASTFGMFGLDRISDGRPVFISFTRPFITGLIPIPVEPESVIVELPEQAVVDQELLLGLNQLRLAGYRIAVPDYRGGSEHAAVLGITDFAVVDVNAVPPQEVSGLVNAARQAGASLVARNIEDADTLQRCVGLGFDLFLGTFLARPSMVTGRTLSPSQLVCVRLLGEMSDADLSVARVEHLVGSDPGLTLRLLRTANSASGGARAEITSLRQAIVLIGPRRLRSWVVLTLLEGGTTRNQSDDLWSVLARAHACQRLASRDQDVAFTVGMLSGCADLLGTPPEQIAEGAGVGEPVRSALVAGDGEAGRALAAVLAHERDDAEAISRTGLEPFDVSRAYLTSLSESLSLVHELTEGDQD